MKKNRYTKEFKEEAVKLAETRPISHVAKDLGINHTMLGKWKTQQKENPINAFTRKGTPEQERIKELEKQLHDVTMQREILKKAVAIFSK